MRKLIKEAINDQLLSVIKKQLLHKEITKTIYTGAVHSVRVEDIVTIPEKENDIRVLIGFFIDGKPLTRDWFTSGFSGNALMDVMSELNPFIRRYFGVDNIDYDQYLY